MADAVKEWVKAQRPGATLCTNGYMFWIEDAGKIISGSKSTAARAWSTAMSFLQAS